MRSGVRFGDVVARMRALFKKAPAAKEPLDINLIIQEVLTLTHGELQKNRVSLRTEFTAGLRTHPQSVFGRGLFPFVPALFFS